MIATIGLMIGVYIVAKLAELMDKKDNATGVNIVAIVAMIVTIGCLVDLVSRLLAGRTQGFLP